MSATVLTSFLNQPPICAPVLPAVMPWTLYLVKNSFSMSMPPPAYSQAFWPR